MVRVLVAVLLIALGLVLPASPAAAASPQPGWTPSDYGAVHADCVTPLSGRGGPLEPAAGCDSYATDALERPTISQPDSTKPADYFSWIDIQQTMVGLDDDFFYFAIDLAGIESGAGLSGSYGYEVDFDGDGAGEYMLDMKNGAVVGTTWSHKDLVMWQDTDDSMGDDNIGVPDGPSAQNGYETLFWKEGTGPADGAWVRISPSDNTVIETAVSLDLVGNPASASLRGWAAKGPQYPGQMHFHDERDAAQYGSPYQSSPYFPPGNIYEVDNGGGLDDPFEAAFYGVTVSPDNTGNTCAATTAVHDHTVTNDSIGIADSFDLSAASTQGWRVELWNSTGTTLIATDNDGNGVWNSVNPSYDSDSNGTPETGPLAAGASISYEVRVLAPAATEGDVDITTLTAVSRADGDISDSATSTTTVEDCRVNPSISVDKSVYLGHDGGSRCPGVENVTTVSAEELTYCFEVTNTGDTTLAPVTLDDIELGVTQAELTVLEGDLGSVPAGGTVRLYHESSSAGDLVNTAAVSGRPVDGSGDPIEGQGDVTGEDTASVDQTAPGVRVAKSVYPGHDGGSGCPGGEKAVGEFGDRVTWCFVVTNTGDTVLDVAVDDPDVGFRGTIDALAAGDSATLFFEGTIEGDLVNTVTVTGDPPHGPPVEHDDEGEVDEIDPGLELAKSVYTGHDDGASCAGSTDLVTGVGGTPVTYCFVVTNTGDTALDLITVDDVDLGVTHSELYVVGFGLSMLLPGDTITFAYDASIDRDLINTATVQARVLDAFDAPVPGPAGQVTDSDSAAVDVIDPGIEIEKTVYVGHDDGAGCAGAGNSVAGENGQSVTWCFTVTNTGDGPVSDVVLDDAVLGVNETDLEVLSGSLATLAPGSSVVLYVEGAIDGDLVNTATASATPPAGPDVSAEDDASVEVLVPGYTLAKTLYRGHDDGASCEGGESVVARAGDPVTWCLLVVNTGETDLDVTVTDPDVGLDETITGLAPGASETLYVEGEVDGDLVNTATGTGVPPHGPPIPHEDTAEVDEIHPALTVDKTIYAGHDDGAGCDGAESVTAIDGDLVTWCFLVTNTGDVDLTDVTLDDLPLLADETDLTVLSGSLATLPAGGSVELYLEASATGDVANTVTATGVPPVGPDVSDEDTAELVVVDPSITLDKTVYAGHDGGAGCDGGELVTGLSGDEVTYCFTVTNATGQGPLTNVQLADLDLDDAGLTLLSGDVAPLADGASAVFYLESTIDGDLVNTGSVTATPAVGPDVSDEDTAEVDEVNAEIALVKSVYPGHTAGAGCAGAGESVADENGRPVTWCFTVTNNGDVTLTDVQVDDGDLGVDQNDLTVLSGSLASLAPGGSVVLYLEGGVDGDLTNTATATATPPAGPEPSDTDTAQVDELVPGYTLDKTVYRGHDDGAGCTGRDRAIARPGDAVTWCVEVRNTGDTVLDIRVTDPDVGLDQTVDDLVPGGHATLFVEGTVDGDLVNTASGTGIPPHGPPIPKEDIAEVDEVHPAISVLKTVYGGHDAGVGCPGGDTYADEAGRPVTWCFTVVNTGDTDLTAVSVDDAALGIDQSDLTSLSGSLALIPAGGSVTLYLEATLDADLVNTATATGIPPVGPDVADEDDASVEVLTGSIAIDKSVYAGHDGGTSCAGVERVVGRSGDEVTWCFLVTNTGGVALDVTVDDPDVGFVGTLADLAPGASATLWFEGTIDGDLVNTATVTGVPPLGPPVDHEDTAEVEEIDPSIQVDKTVYLGHDDGAGCAGVESVESEAGDDVTWCFAITNTGDVDLVDIDLADPVLGIDQSDVTLLSGTLATLAPDATIVAYLEGTVDGDIDNTVTAGGIAPDDSRLTDDDTAAVTVVAPQIGIAKTVIEGPTGNGDGTYTLTYRLRVANAGETRLDDVQATDDLSETFGGARSFRVDEVISADLSVNDAYDGRPTGSIELLTGTDDLEIAERGDIEVTVTVDPGADLGPYENTAHTTGTSPGGHEVEDYSDSGTDADPTAPNPDEPGDTGGTDDPVPVEFPAIDLTVVKTVGDVRIDGDLAIVDWRMVVTNAGPGDDAGPITVTDELDERLTFVSATGDGWDCEATGRRVICLWDAALAAGDSTTEIQLLTEMDAPIAGEVTNVAHVASTGAESRTDNNHDAAVVSAGDEEESSSGTLPRTGAAIGTLVLLALGLVLGGRLLQRRGARSGA